ncbi:undecaprenyl-phosphate glucose phosphotransferase [Flavihumibacter sp. R14]|nr:undecaprenyl-phosphate glucose phosphotransferase [Flavihumibacter soli]
MENRFLYSLRIILILSDLLLINSAYFVAHYLNNITLGDQSFDYYKQNLISVNFIWLISANVFQLYNKANIENIEQIFRSTWKSVALHAGLFVFYFAFYQELKISNYFIFLFYSLCIGAFIVSRFLCTVLEIEFIRRYKTGRSVAVLGLNQMGLRLAAFFESNKKQYSFQGFLDSDDDSILVDPSGQLLPGTCEQIRMASERNIKDVYVSLRADRMNEAGSLIVEAEKQCVRLKFVPDFSHLLDTPFTIDYVGEFPVFSVRNEPLESIDNRFKKRLVDIVFSLFVIVFLLSWLFPLIALIIKLESRGPIMFKQLRSGRDNSKFFCYKFRSMSINRESDSRQASKGDERVTYFGRFMRKTSMDELPQFFNVLIGNMSVVGPRPHMLRHTEEYRAIIDKYMVRHHLKPGITGWAQINGLRGQTDRRELMEKRVEHDIWYLNNWSIMLDIKIIFLTVINIVRGETNAY